MVLPIGQLSEEAAKASNKVIRKTRTEHTHKISRLSTNEDLIHMLLANSDPLISSMRKKKKKQPTEDYNAEVRNMLHYETDDNEEDDIEEEDI